MNAKKAIWALENLSKMLLIIAGFFIVAVFMYKLFSALQTESVEQACRTSALTRTKVRNIVEEAVIIDKNIFPINCKTQDKVLPTEELDKRATDKERKEHLMEMLADDMANCWWMFLNGKYGDLLDQDSKISQSLCHVCYSVYIREIKDDNGDPIEFTTSEFEEYLVTHAYKPGLLQGGNAAVGGLDIIEFENQIAIESSRAGKRMNAEKLLSSRTKLNNGMADFTENVFANQQQLQFEIEAINIELSNKRIIEQVFIILPSLPEEAYEEHPNLPIEILNEWHVGLAGMNNGAVYVFDLKNGRLFYASAQAANALFPEAVVRQVFNDGMNGEKSPRELFSEYNQAEAIHAFANGLKSLIYNENSGYSEALEFISFQNTYLAYITGGLVDPDSITRSGTNEQLSQQGEILFDATLTKEGFATQERYAIAYVSKNWYESSLGINFAWLTGRLKKVNGQSNAIVVTYHDKLVGGDTSICNVHTEDR